MRLSWKESYRAAYGFLDAIWQAIPEPERELLSELDAFLGGMMLLDTGVSADPAIAELWHDTAARVTHGSGWGDMSGEEAYAVMVRFLAAWAADRSDGTILGVCEDLERTGPDREGWARAVDMVLQGDFDPYFGLTEENEAPLSP